MPVLFNPIPILEDIKLLRKIWLSLSASQLRDSAGFTPDFLLAYGYFSAMNYRNYYPEKLSILFL
jgi:hypothetical protein